MDREVWVSIILGTLVVVFLLIVTIADRCYIGYASRVSRCVKNLEDAVERLLAMQHELVILDPQPSTKRVLWGMSVQGLHFRAEAIRTKIHRSEGLNLLYLIMCYYYGKQADKELMERAVPLVEIGKALLKEAWRRLQTQTGYVDLDLDLAPYSARLAAEGKGQRAAWQMLAPDSQNRIRRTDLPPLPAGMSSYRTIMRFFVERRRVGAPWLLGIWGMRGVGKTTFLRFARDSYAHDDSFDHVFFVGAGAGCTVGKLQHVLSINISPLYGQTPTSRLVPMADFITSSLRRKTFLLLIDDVGERLDLAAVGLPMPLGHNQKVIFTTRYPAICAEMGCATNTIQMKCFGEDDAWSLFKEKVGDKVINSHPHVKRLAKKMVAECRGLPSALCTLGRAMSTKRDVKEWRYAYDVLLKCKPPPHQADEIQEMDNDGYSHLHQLEDTLRDSCLF